MLGSDARVKVKIRRGVDVTAHRRTLLFRAGTVAVLATGALVGTAAPAFADATVVIGGNLDASLTVGGGPQTVNVQVKNTGDTPQLAAVKLTIDIPSDLGLSISSKPGGCSGSGTHLDCTIDGPLAPNSTKNLPVGIAPPAQSSIPAGQTKTGTPGQVIITDGGSDTKPFNASLKAQAAAPTTQAAPTTVTEVSGTITDSQTGKGIAGATVVLADGSGKERQLTSGSTGSFKFTGSEQNPIAPGAMTITAGATNYENSNAKPVTGTAGKASTGIKIGLVVLADTASAAPLPSANDGAIVEGQSAGGVVPQNTATNNASNDSGGGVSWILIALGVLLVGFGIVAIVLLLRRRGDDDDDENEDEPAPRRGGPGGVRPGYAGGGAGPDPTMVGAMGPAPTMVNRGGNNDATAIVRPGRGVFDDVPPDPYGAPPPGPGGYPSAGGYDAGFASGGYNGGGANGYGPQGRPAPGPAVDPYAPDYNGGGQGGGGYPDATQRYEPGTGGNGYGGGNGNNGYNHNPATGGNNYGGQGGQGGQGGYGANGYDGPSAGGGYGGGGQQGRGDYEGPPTTLGGFGGGDRGGYDGPPAGGDRGGYDGPPAGGGYDGPSAGGGYNPAGGGADRGGYGQGYDDRGGYSAGGGQYDGPSAGGGYSPAGGGDRGGYGQGYDDRGGYGQGGGGQYDGPSAGGGYAPGGDRGGYGPGNGGGGAEYDQPYAGRGGYGPGGGGGADRGGYEPAAGYERDGYERVPEPPRAGNGYGPGGGPGGPGGGGGGGEYDQRGGYGPNGGGGDYDDARSQGRGGNRRSLDWLDD